MFRRRAPFFCAFDVLMLDGENVRGLPLLERKRRLFDVMPRVESRLRYVDHVHESGGRFFELACERGELFEQRRSPEPRPRRKLSAPTLVLS